MNAGIPIQYFLILATVMFFTGVYGFLTRRNLITILMSVELILNSVNINFLAFNRYLYPHKPDDSSGCAVGGGWLSAKALGPWLLAGLFGAIVMLARRRRR